MPKIVDHEQYRKELLSKCFDLFAEKGYGALTMREIAQSLNVSTGTLYHYFASKQALFEQLVEEISQQDLTSALAEIKPGLSLVETMKAVGKYLAKNEDYFIKQAYIWVEFCQHQEQENIRNSPVFQRVNHIYQQAICNFFGVEDPVLVSFVLSFFNGLIISKLWGDENIDYCEQCVLLGKMLTQYLQVN